MLKNGFTYEKMMTQINSYIEKYSVFSANGLCNSILGRNIPVIVLGEGENAIAYIGGLMGSDGISPRLLMRFVRDICSSYAEDTSVFGFSARRIFKEYTLVIIPMLNPDGRDYCVNGIAQNNPLRERLIKENAGNTDFSRWRGNARGVELRHNFGLENGENEPEIEVGNLCNFLRFGLTPKIIFELSADRDFNNCIYFGDGEGRSKIATALTQMSGIERRYRQSNKIGMTLSDWADIELEAASFSVEFKAFDTEGERNDENEVFSLYIQIRKMLFCAPILSKI